jgi:predicted DCC family thiol-disulfide oxidoreductase YuxK
MQTDGPIAVMDGDCALCSFGARMIHRLDRSGRIRICLVGTPLGQTLLARHGVTPGNPETWLFVDGPAVWRDFDAMAEVGRRTGGWGHGLRLLRLLPGPVSRWLYARVARNRYAVFGRSRMCDLPDPAFRARLIG